MISNVVYSARPAPGQQGPRWLNKSISESIEEINNNEDGGDSCLFSTS